MLKEIKWEFKKIILVYKYYALAMIGALVLTFFLPDGVWMAPILVVLVLGIIYLMFFPFNNVMQLFKQPGFNFERQKRVSAYDQLIAKLCVNAVLVSFMELIENIAHYTTQYFVFIEYKTIGLIIFEIAIFYPLVFLCIYYWLGKTSKVSHGLISGFLCILLYRLIDSMKLELVSIIIIEIVPSILLIYVLGKWIEKTKEPYC